jgi:arginine N-succinyltransferase
MLPETATHVMGVPHPSGRAAMRMLEREGFRQDSYIDIFDGGPTMIAATDEVRTIRDSRTEVLGSIEPEVDGPAMMLAAGSRGEFVAACGNIRHEPDGTAALDGRTAELLRVRAGDSFLAMSR